jgi:hypothetical protein
MPIRPEYRDTNRYQVIELATGTKMGEPCGRIFAQYVLDVRNWPGQPPLFGMVPA